MDILRTVNDGAQGGRPFHATLLHEAARALAHERQPSYLVAWMEILSSHPKASPHIRELATEALHYLVEDAVGGPGDMTSPAIR